MITIGKKDINTLLDFGDFFSSHANRLVFLSVNGGYRTLQTSAFSDHVIGQICCQVTIFNIK